MATNKLIVLGLGGAGINASDKALKSLRDLGSGFADVEFHFMDTSRNNFDNIEPIGTFYQTKRLASNDKNVINGAGGDRSGLAAEILANVPDFLDSIKLTKRETNTFVCVIASTSGGSGGSGLIGVVDALMEKGIPCFAIIIGDSGDALKLRNTQAVIATLNHKAVTKGKCLISYYVNNAEMDPSQTVGERKANERISNVMGVMSLFLSGDNESLDSTDMANFINQQDYKGIKTPPGLYSLSFHKGAGDIKLPEYCLPTVARTLTAPGLDVAFNLNVLHHKIGQVVDQNVFDKFGENAFPIHIVASSGLLKEEINQLSKLNEASAQRQNDLKATMIEAPVHASMDEDTGMFF